VARQIAGDADEPEFAGSRRCRRLAGVDRPDPALAHKQGGILQMPDFASPASMSMHEESTITAGIPLMGVFNNLVVFDQHVAQNSCPEYREMKAATLRAPFHHGRHSELQGLK
jgi:hypothetical protein